MNSLQSLEEHIKSNNNFTKFIVSSEVPNICKSEACMLGVDEAGRGPVLGPMVYGVAYCPLSQKDVLKSLGCADSKALTEEKRDDILLRMLTEEHAYSNVGWIAEVISPNYISNSMYRRAKHSLNEVSMNSAISLIKNVIEQGANIAEVYVDTVGPPEKYQAKLSEIFPDIKIIVAKKADSIYPIVSAASIVAKVTRDHALKVWQFPEGLQMDHTEYGSGYPGDPSLGGPTTSNESQRVAGYTWHKTETCGTPYKRPLFNSGRLLVDKEEESDSLLYPLTKKFIRDQIDHVFGYPLLVRFSWSTAENVLQEKAAKCTFEEVEEDGKKKPNTRAISTFFSPKNEKKRKRHKFFEERYLTFDNAFE